MCSASGCSSKGGIKRSFERSINKGIEDSSGISSDSTYREYRTMLAGGKIRNNYYYDENTPVLSLDEQDSDMPSAGARVSFSGSNFLNVRYFTDENMENEITDPEKNIIYLEPGQKLYAVTELSASAVSGTYQFTEFRIYEHTGGSSKLISSGYDEETGLIYTVPDDCAGLDISVEPAGEYRKKSIS